MSGYTPGDILLVRNKQAGSSLISQLIMAGERARYGDVDDARWTHCALIVGTDGSLVEALDRGIVRTNLRKYADAETLVVPIPVPTGDPRRAYAVRFAEAQAGTRYDVLDFVGLAFSLLTGLNVSLHQDRAYICSGLVARATEGMTESGYPYPPEAMTPADLGYAFAALSGQPLPALSFIGRVLDRFRAVVRTIF